MTAFGFKASYPIASISTLPVKNNTKPRKKVRFFLPLSFASQPYLITIEILIAHLLVSVEVHSLSKHFLVLLLSQLPFFPAPHEKANLENEV